MKATTYTVTALAGVPMVRKGDDLARMVLDAMSTSDMVLADGDIVVLAQKIVSKAEGREVVLESVIPSGRALELAEVTRKDPRLVELVLRETSEVLRAVPDVLIVRHKLGLVLANAGIDQSNVREGSALLLPLDPDASAAILRENLQSATGRSVVVLVIDSLGRAWRLGTAGTAIGCAGLPAVLDLRGRPDINGRPLESSELCVADEVAAAASLAMGQSNEATPIVIVRGLRYSARDLPARDIVRPVEKDLFQ